MTVQSTIEVAAPTTITVTEFTSTVLAAADETVTVPTSTAAVGTQLTVATGVFAATVCADGAKPVTVTECTCLYDYQSSRKYHQTMASHEAAEAIPSLFVAETPGHQFMLRIVVADLFCSTDTGTYTPISGQVTTIPASYPTEAFVSSSYDRLHVIFLYPSTDREGRSRKPKSYMGQFTKP